jgi:hypothetical protein
MQRQATIRVPAALSGELKELLALLSAVKAESAAAAQDGAAEEAVRSVSDLLGQIGEGAGDAEVTGPAGIVREALYGLLIDGADALAEGCRSYESGSLSLDDLSAVGASTLARVELFLDFERSDGEG